MHSTGRRAAGPSVLRTLVVPDLPSLALPCKGTGHVGVGAAVWHLGVGEITWSHDRDTRLPYLFRALSSRCLSPAATWGAELGLMGREPGVPGPKVD